MPELPEVETIRRGLALHLAGRRFAEVVQRRPDLRFPLPDDLPRRLAGRRIETIGRRAKYLLVGLDDGMTMLLHLGMSGRLVLDGPPLGPHEHLTFRIEGGRTLRLVDPRRFGLLDLCATGSLASHPRLVGLGPEPLDEAFDGPRLLTLIAGRRSALKVALMDQRVVVGVGNIYASEALFRARLSPRRTPMFLRPGQTGRLTRAIKEVLLDAIEAGGSTLRDYVRSDGEVGFFQFHFQVYDREGAPCSRCGRPIRRIVQAARATFHCPGCQR